MSTATPKDPKNLPCECGSKKKAKHCCLKNLPSIPPIPSIYKTGQEISSEKILNCITMLKDKYPSHKIIDITDRLNNSTYKPYQIANFTDQVIMVAEKTDSNASVFTTRVESSVSDIMIMYHGAFRTFPYDYLDRVFSSVCAMIK